MRKGAGLDEVSSGDQHQLFHPLVKAAAGSSVLLCNSSVTGDLDGLEPTNQGSREGWGCESGTMLEGCREDWARLLVAMVQTCAFVSFGCRLSKNQKQ
jgi:hypothetical protein